MRAMPNRNVQIGSGAAVARLMGRPVCPRLRKCRVRPAGTLGATSRHSRGPPATAAVDLSCEQATAIIAHGRESHGRDLSLAIEGGDFPRWTLFIQMMTDAQAKPFRFNLLTDQGVAVGRLSADRGRDDGGQPLARQLPLPCRLIDRLWRYGNVERSHGDDGFAKRRLILRLPRLLW